MVTLTRESELFTFTSDKNVLLQLKRRPWGTYILGSWIDGGVNLTGGGTDMEYVFRAGNSPAALYFSGGNHGNEALCSIDLFAPDGSAADSGAAYEYITVVQKTRLFCNTDPDKIDYSDESWHEKQQHYCNITRKYRITDTQIHLEVDYDYVRDCFLGLSYTAMFPIIKTHGLYCAFYDGDRLLSTVETSRIGKPDYSGPFLGKEAADRVLIWGWEDPSRKVEVRIYTPEDSVASFSGSHRTFFWDMNATHNKLYFSRSSIDMPETVTAGTKRHTVTTWTLIHDNN